MALTITLPVVVTPLVTEKSVEKPPAVMPGSPDSRLIDFEEEGVEVERALIAEEETVEELHELKYNKWLMAAQCIFGPLWCVVVLFGESSNTVLKSPLIFGALGLDEVNHEEWLLLTTAITGAAAATLVLIFSSSGEHSTMRILRCSMGFFVAIVWIMAIADEVVGVLRVSCLH